MDMEHASLLAFVNVKMGSLVLTVLLVKEYPLFTLSFHLLYVLLTDYLFNYGETTYYLLFGGFHVLHV
jgi:hypothetical protein